MVARWGVMDRSGLGTSARMQRVSSVAGFCSVEVEGPGFFARAPCGVPVALLWPEQLFREVRGRQMQLNLQLAVFQFQHAAYLLFVDWSMHRLDRSLTHSMCQGSATAAGVCGMCVCVCGGVAVPAQLTVRAPIQSTSSAGLVLWVFKIPAGPCDEGPPHC